MIVMVVVHTAARLAVLVWREAVTARGATYRFFEHLRPSPSTSCSRTGIICSARLPPPRSDRPEPCDQPSADHPHSTRNSTTKTSRTGHLELLIPSAAFRIEENIICIATGLERAGRLAGVDIENDEPCRIAENHRNGRLRSIERHRKIRAEVR